MFEKEKKMNRTKKDQFLKEMLLPPSKKKKKKKKKSTIVEGRVIFIKEKKNIP